MSINWPNTGGYVGTTFTTNGNTLTTTGTNTLYASAADLYKQGNYSLNEKGING